MYNDEQIINEVLAGQLNQYKGLVSRYQQKVFSVALKITNNQKDAEDIAQEVFLQAYLSLSTYQFDSSFSTWLYRITVNKGIDWRRKNKHTLNQEVYQEQQEKSSEFIPEDLLLRKDRQESIKIMLNKLPKAYQSVLVLYYFDNLSYHQIADQLGIAKKTVESRLYRAKLLMKERLRKERLE